MLATELLDELPVRAAVMNAVASQPLHLGLGSYGILSAQAVISFQVLLGHHGRPQGSCASHLPVYSTFTNHCKEFDFCSFAAALNPL